MKRKLSLIEPIEDPCRAVLKRFKEKRTKILKQSLKKLKDIPDAEQCLRQAVLIRNTFIRAKDLSPKTFEKQLPELTPNSLDKDNADLLVDLYDQLNNHGLMETEDDSDLSPKPKQYKTEEISQTFQSDCSSVTSNDLNMDNRQLVAVS